jgi:hypothetical protein
MIRVEVWLSLYLSLVNYYLTFSILLFSSAGPMNTSQNLLYQVYLGTQHATKLFCTFAQDHHRCS